MLARVIAMSQIQSARWAFNCGSWSPTQSDWQQLASGLNAQDKEDVGKFVFQRDAKSAMAGRFIMKKFVCEATGLPWKDVKILRDSEHKKPYFPEILSSGRKIQFNISHSGEFVVLAGEVGDVNVGVDLMKIEHRTTTVPEFFRLMTKLFAPGEWDVVKSQRTEREQLGMFYRFWCLKESYTKATGTGITVDLQKICFKLNNLYLTENTIVDNTEVYVNGCKQEGWKFEESLVDSEHIAAVALYSSDLRFKLSSCGQLFTQICYSELISQSQHISEIDEDYCRRFMAKRKLP